MDNTDKVEADKMNRIGLEAVDKFTNPDDPEFDLTFALSIIKNRPDLFSEEQKQKVFDVQKGWRKPALKHWETK